MNVSSALTVRATVSRLDFGQRHGIVNLTEAVYIQCLALRRKQFGAGSQTMIESGSG